MHMIIALPNTVRHHGADIPPRTIVRTMRGQRRPSKYSPEWIEIVWSKNADRP